MAAGNRDVSVIIPTYNRATALAMVLPTYIAENPGEIIVVDDGGTDQTHAVVKELSAASSTPVHYIQHNGRMGAPAARNTGLDHASGDYILFGEDDVLLEAGYLTGLLREMAKTGADIMGGRIVGMKLGEDKTFAISRADAYSGNLIDLINIEGHFGKYVDGAVDVPFLHSVALMRTSLARRIRFDAGYRGNGYREETDFYIRARTQGARIVFTPRSVCFHVSGSINRSGGQRMNRASYEFWAVINNARFVHRNYDALRELCRWQRGPLATTCSYAAFRLVRLFSKVTRRLRASLTN